MSRPTTEFEHGDIRIEITKVPAKDAFQGVARAVRLLGPMLLIAGPNASDDQRMVALFEKFNDADYIELRRLYLENSKLLVRTERSDGSTFDTKTSLRVEAFDEDVEALFAWFMRATVFNFGSFLGRSATSERRQRESAPGPSSSTSPSTGGSGG